MTSNSSYKELLSRNEHVARWIVHLFQQKERGRLMMVVGAGASDDACVPGWKELVEKISAEVRKAFPDETVYGGGGTTFTSQILRKKLEKNRSALDDQGIDIKRLHVTQEWNDLLHSALYSKTPETIDELFQTHPYLRSMASLALATPYVLTFNFDDLLWEAMMKVRTERKASNPSDDTRLPNLIWRPQITEPANATTIYHINGILPHRKLAKRSEELVFTEDSFADAYVSVNTPVFEQHIYKMSSTTQLIIGHSLEDASLRNLLRTLRKRVPANVSYYIRYDEGKLSERDRQDIFEANLDVYNLITIFAGKKEISELFALLSLDEEQFRTEMALRGCQSLRQSFYVVGPVASGKTTTLENLRHFVTLEEWPTSIVQAMYIRSDAEDAKQKSAEINDAVDRNLLIKNRYLENKKIGFHFIDRGPMDALAFQNSTEERTRRKSEILGLMGGKVEEGEICLLATGGEECVRRNWKRGRPPSKGGDAEYFETQLSELRKAYGLPSGAGYGSDKSDSGSIARQITLKALLGPYEPWKASV